MSVDTRQSLFCLRYPSRFESIFTTQLSQVHTGELTRPLDSKKQSKSSRNNN